MIPIIAGLLMLYAIAQRNDAPAVKRVSVPLKKAKPVPIPVSARRTTAGSFKNNLQRPVGIDEYQRTVIQPSPFVASPQLKLAQLFKDKYCQLKHVQHTPHNQQPYVQIQEFKNESGRKPWLILTIPTRYQNLYLSLMLDEQHNIPFNTQGVLISFDDLGLSYFLQSCSEDQRHRFGYVVYKEQSVVDSESLLQLLIGDSLHPYSVNHYLLQREVKY